MKPAACAWAIAARGSSYNEDLRTNRFEQNEEDKPFAVKENNIHSGHLYRRPQIAVHNRDIRSLLRQFVIRERSLVTDFKSRGRSDRQAGGKFA